MQKMAIIMVVRVQILDTICTSQDRRMSQKETREEPKEVIGERASTCGKVS